MFLFESENLVKLLLKWMSYWNCFCLSLNGEIRQNCANFFLHISLMQDNSRSSDNWMKRWGISPKREGISIRRGLGWNSGCSWIQSRSSKRIFTRLSKFKKTKKFHFFFWKPSLLLFIFAVKILKFI